MSLDAQTSVTAVARRRFLMQLGLGTSALVAGGSSRLGWGRAVADEVGTFGLPRDLPENQGVSSAGIRGFVNAITEAKLPLHSFMLLRHGKVLAEAWWAPYAAGRKHTLYSLTKSFSATAVGFAVEEGRFRTDDKVAELLSDKIPKAVSPHKADLRVEHLLMMAAGHAKDPLNMLGKPPADGDWVRAVLEQPIEFAPGTHFTYSNGAVLLISAIIQKTTGKTLHAYLKEKLFQPLNITGEDWEIHPNGVNPGGWGLRLKTEDIAKFGQLYLQKGVWNGRRLLSESWVERATHERIATPKVATRPDWGLGYGYYFWRSRHGAYRGDGAFGQFCIVMPDRDAVFVTTAESPNMQAVLDVVWTHLLPAFHDKPLSPDAAADKALKTTLKGLTMPHPAGKADSPMAAIVSGAYAFEDNPLGIRKVVVDFQGPKCAFTLVDAKGEHHINSQFHQWTDNPTKLSVRHLHLAAASDPPVEVLSASCAWPMENRFVMHWYFPVTAHHDTAICQFDGDRLNVSFQKSVGKDQRPAIVGQRES